MGGISEKSTMGKADLLHKNRMKYEFQGKTLNAVAPPHVRVLVVANPVNINCLIMSKFAENIPRENFTALTKLDENRAKSLLAKKLKMGVNKIENV